MKKKLCIVLAALIALNISACGKSKISDPEASSEVLSDTEISTEEKVAENILHFVDAHGENYQVKINDKWKKHSYELSAFIHDGDKLIYENNTEYTFRLGIDVSKFQGQIDWQAVKEDGYDFVFVRVGYRGYGEAGTLNEDPFAIANIKEARAAGLDVGLYFFSQAINEDEAVEEANYAISLVERAGLSSSDITLPIVFDPESISADDARTDSVTGEQFTANTVAFCRAVNQAGYTSMIYCNMIWQAYFLDLKVFEDNSIPVWYADYEEKPQSPYDFQYWQYTEKGTVAGIEGGVDIDIQLIKK